METITPPQTPSPKASAKSGSPAQPLPNLPSRPSINKDLKHTVGAREGELDITPHCYCITNNDVACGVDVAPVSPDTDTVVQRLDALSLTVNTLTAWYLCLLRICRDDGFHFDWQFNDLVSETSVVAGSLSSAHLSVIEAATLKDVITAVEREIHAYDAKIHLKLGSTNPRVSMSGPRYGSEEPNSLLADFDGFSLAGVEIVATYDNGHIVYSIDAPTPHVEALLHASLSSISKTFSTNTTIPAQQVLRLNPWDLSQISTWNASLPQKFETCMHLLISSRCELIPDKTAISSWDGQLTFGEVETYSNPLANKLLKSGLQPGQVIPICFEKSRWTVVATLAVMKAGGVFVLMDHSQPLARLQTIANDVQASLMLSSDDQKRLCHQVMPTAQVVSVSASSLAEMTDSDSINLTPAAVKSSSMMYIIFTSGSTGKPKGVMISHENYVSGAIPRGQAVGFTTESRVIDFASYAFDVSIDSMLITLMNGGCLCIPSDEERLNDLNGFIRRERITMVNITPSVARILGEDVIEQLSEVGVGGEAVSAHDVQKWGEKARVVVGYGPSECTVGCTINSSAAKGRNYIDLGQPTGSVLWIVNPQDVHVLVPVGAIGELCIEGPVVGLGYLNDPIKTSAAFIDSPKWLDLVNRKGRVYLTGDLVKYDPNGSGALLFAGRKDTQVKLRGQRVELGEVEFHLSSHLPPNATVTVEVISRGVRDEQNLVAFVSCSGGGAADSELVITSFDADMQRSIEQAKNVLAETLPKYMAPSLYVPINHTPIMASSKTDRKRLRALAETPEFARLCKAPVTPSQKSELGLPASQLARELTKLWASLLGVDSSAIYMGSNFFVLGGDSVTAMRLVGLSRRQNLPLTVQTIFQNPTLAGMAQAIDRIELNQATEVSPFSLLDSSLNLQDAIDDASQYCGVDKSIITDIYPCSPLQETLTAFSARSEQDQFAQRVMELPKGINVGRFKNAWEATYRECSILRTRIADLAGRGLAQVIVDEPLSWVHSKDLDTFLQQDLDKRMQVGAQLSRYAIVESSKLGKRWFVWSIHHALYDAWSTDLIIRRFQRHFEGVKVDPPTSMRHFVRYLIDPERDKSLDYWKARLQGGTGPQLPILPSRTYLPKPDTVLSRKIFLRQQEESIVTVSTIVHGAWALTASEYIGSPDIIFGETLTGRTIDVAGIEDIDGPTITTVPVRVHVDRDETVQDYLLRIQREGVELIPHQHTGLQYIRRVSNDAQVACEIKTGIVIHPAQTSTDDTALVESTLKFDQASSSAQETLKFNSYPLMLVFALSSNGFEVFASFDSALIDELQMSRVLSFFGRAIHAMTSRPNDKIGNLELICAEDLEQIWRLNRSPPASIHPETGQLVVQAFDDSGQPQITVPWILDSRSKKIVPSGAIGELFLEGPLASTDFFEDPKWLVEGHTTVVGRAGKLHRIGQRAKYGPAGSIILCDPHLSARGEELHEPSDPEPPQLSSSAAPQRQQSSQDIILREAWSQLLSIEASSIRDGDNFFNLGADSILAMKLVTILRKAEFKITVADIFRNMEFDSMLKVMQPIATVNIQRAVAYTPFSLLGQINRSKFLDDSVRPFLAVANARIEDVLPVTDSQHIDIRATVEMPRSSVQYNVLTFPNGVDTLKLAKACESLVRAHQILRTVFIAYEQSYLQVILEKMTDQIEYAVSHGGDEQRFVRDLCDRDVESALTLGSPFVKFCIISRDDDGQAMSLVFRISHAQYDGVSLPNMLRQLNLAFKDVELRRPECSFGMYLDHVRKARQRSLDYWRNHLNGAQPYPLKPRTDVSKSTETIFINRTVGISRPSVDNFTSATVLTAAWALLLAKTTNRHDVTFGKISSGRNLDIHGATQISGPCYQFIPVRVSLDLTSKVRDVLQSIQTQAVDCLLYETIGARSIVQECTDWSADDALLDSVVHHQDLDDFDEMPFGEGRCRVDVINPHAETSAQWRVMTYPKEGQLMMGIQGAASWSSFIEDTLDELMNIHARLCANLDAEVGVLLSSSKRV